MAKIEVELEADTQPQLPPNRKLVTDPKDLACARDVYGASPGHHHEQGLQAAAAVQTGAGDGPQVVTGHRW